MYFANFLDTTFTAIWLNAGIAEEINPIMGWVYLTCGVYWFITIKILVGAIALAILYVMRRRMLARILMIPVVLLYSYVSIIHIWASFYL